MRVRFGDCVFDSESRELRRGGAGVRLSPKGFRLLEALLSSRPRAVSRQELHDQLWPRTFVSATGLGRLVVEVRSAIGDDARRPRFVRTVHGFGYAFSGDALEDESGSTRWPDPGEAAFRLVWGRREIDLAPGENLLGRIRGCAVWIDEPGISRRHARITVSPGEARIEDLGSKNGTYLRGKRLEGASRLADGDEIALGTALMTVRIVRSGASTRSEASR